MWWPVVAHGGNHHHTVLAVALSRRQVTKRQQQAAVMTRYNQKERKDGGIGHGLALLGVFHLFTAPTVSLSNQPTVLNVTSSSRDVTVAYFVKATGGNGDGRNRRGIGSLTDGERQWKNGRGYRHESRKTKSNTRRRLQQHRPNARRRRFWWFHDSHTMTAPTRCSLDRPPWSSTSDGWLKGIHGGRGRIEAPEVLT
ncbi:unnamed protein product [Lactuca saligna]|uniref:Uncharacterized protein n=1 Tax=Lactuca saligna TaxID=75948 RepID=A0AA35UT06_LACSI|nr:unnamed protein product [Lactuca saligna]